MDRKCGNCANFDERSGKIGSCPYAFEDGYMLQVSAESDACEHYEMANAKEKCCLNCAHYDGVEGTGSCHKLTYIWAVENELTMGNNLGLSYVPLRVDYEDGHIDATIEAVVFAGMECPGFIRAEEKSFCQNCGRRIVYLADYCHSCGERIMYEEDESDED